MLSDKGKAFNSSQELERWNTLQCSLECVRWPNVWGGWGAAGKQSSRDLFLPEPLFSGNKLISKKRRFAFLADELSES
ncbi:hypothetical protein TNCT_453791 [Trichonephila clavata]|uniref:Uncharacterized protein n=1 Tax=Trichonephila clavata TaxID=2740835 RepID=A0A8X6L814_TRICU|nr:hypothetical protein TNCT_453791 [Trichonephila clavata]